MYGSYQPGYSSRFSRPLEMMQHQPTRVQAMSVPQMDMPEVPITSGYRPKESIGAGVGALIGTGALIAALSQGGQTASPGSGWSATDTQVQGALDDRGFSSSTGDVYVDPQVSQGMYEGGV